MTTLAMGQKAVGKKILSAVLPGIPWRVLYVVGILLVMVLMVWYVIQINTLTGGTYLIKEYNKKITNLSAENANLQGELANTGFLESLQERVAALHFEKTQTITYVQVVENALASAK